MKTKRYDGDLRALDEGLRGVGWCGVSDAYDSTDKGLAFSSNNIGVLWPSREKQQQQLRIMRFRCTDRVVVAKLDCLMKIT